MRRHIMYARYVLRHKWFVFVECLKLGVPIWIAIAHDWDKFKPSVWQAYAKTFYAPDGTSRYESSAYFAEAWMKHQHINKHHWQYWLWVNMPYENCAARIQETDYLVWDSGKPERVVTRHVEYGSYPELRPPVDADTVGYPDPMPEVYIREMVADWRGAGRALGFNDAAGWYQKNRDKIMLHPDTRKRVEELLGVEAVMQ